MEKKNKKAAESFTAYMQRTIAALEREERFGTARVYYYALRSFTSFIGGGEIFFGALNRWSLKRFENHLLDSLCSWNTVSTYARALRAIYNRAVDEEIVEGEYRLFNNVFTGAKAEKKRALQAGQMHQLLEPENPDCTARPEGKQPGKKHRPEKKAPKEGQPEETSRLQANIPEPIHRSQDLLALMLLLQGMPFTDLIHLRKDDLKNDAEGEYHLSCLRRKTATPLNVTVPPKALALIERYKSNNPSSPYLLSFFDEIRSAQEIYKEYQLQLRKLNYGLSRLPGYCGMEGLKISSYTARHTWATLAKYCQVPEEVISEGLGHSSLKVTRTYLKRFDGDELARANRIIMEYIFTGKKNTWERQ